MRTLVPAQRDDRWAPTSRAPQLTGCPHCRAPAEVVPWHRRSTLQTPQGNVRSRCLQGHWSLQDAAPRVLQPTR